MRRGTYTFLILFASLLLTAFSAFAITRTVQTPLVKGNGDFGEQGF